MKRAILLSVLSVGFLAACDVQTVSVPAPAPSGEPLPQVSRSGRPQTLGPRMAPVTLVHPDGPPRVSVTVPASAVALRRTELRRHEQGLIAWASRAPGGPLTPMHRRFNRRIVLASSPRSAAHLTIDGLSGAGPRVGLDLAEEEQSDRERRPPRSR